MVIRVKAMENVRKLFGILMNMVTLLPMSVFPQVRPVQAVHQVHQVHHLQAVPLKAVVVIVLQH